MAYDPPILIPRRKPKPKATAGAFKFKKSKGANSAENRIMDEALRPALGKKRPNKPAGATATRPAFRTRERIIGKMGQKALRPYKFGSAGMPKRRMGR